MEQIPDPSGAPMSSAGVKSSVQVKKKLGKVRVNLPKQSVKIMFNWLLAHLHDAYPDEKEKIRLVRETQLTLGQVSNWFINARRRILPGLLEKNGQNPEDFRITRKKNKTPKLCNDRTNSDRDSIGDSDDLSPRLNSSIKKNSNSNVQSVSSIKKNSNSNVQSVSSIKKNSNPKNVQSVLKKFKTLKLSNGSWRANLVTIARDRRKFVKYVKRRTYKKIMMDKPQHIIFLKVGKTEGITDIIQLIQLSYVAELYTLIQSKLKKMLDTK